MWSEHDCQSQPITIVIKDDSEVEADETLSLSLLSLSDSTALGTPDTVQITIRDNDNPPPCNFEHTLQPAQYDLKLQPDDEPVTLTFANAQSTPTVLQPPEGQVASLTLPMTYENDALQVEIIPYDIGTTSLVIGDCASEASVNITVEAEITSDNCQADEQQALKLESTHVTLLEQDKPITITVTGGQGGQRLTQAPNAEIVTVQAMTFPEYTAAQLTLAPRRAGSTQLTLTDCASEVKLTIQVIKENSYAYYCWLADKTEGICNHPQPNRLVLSNSVGIKSNGQDFEPATRFDGSIMAHQQGQQIVILPDETHIKAEFLVYVDPQHHHQPAELIAVAQHQTPEGTLELLMLEGENWQHWDDYDLATLSAITTRQLTPLFEHTLELDQLLAPNERKSGEFTFYFGYRLDNGSIVFNGNGLLHLQIANNQVINDQLNSQGDKRFRTYFKNSSTAEQMSMMINVEPQHEHQSADILMVVLTNDGKSYMRSGEQWEVWPDAHLEKLKVFEKNVQLQSGLRKPLFTDDELDQFRRKFTLYSEPLTIYLGYRLHNQLIVYSQLPLDTIIQ